VFDDKVFDGDGDDHAIAAFLCVPADCSDIS
jgi:hypothetical protein